MKKPIKNILIFIIVSITMSLVLDRGDIEWGRIMVGCITFAVVTLVISRLKDE